MQNEKMLFIKRNWHLIFFFNIIFNRLNLITKHNNLINWTNTISAFFWLKKWIVLFLNLCCYLKLKQSNTYVKRIACVKRICRMHMSNACLKRMCRMHVSNACVIRICEWMCQTHSNRNCFSPVKSYVMLH